MIQREKQTQKIRSIKIFVAQTNKNQTHTLRKLIKSKSKLTTYPQKKTQTLKMMRKILNFKNIYLKH
jgi:hypothetical protein